jgi:hypothetical protein
MVLDGCAMGGVPGRSEAGLFVKPSEIDVSLNPLHCMRFQYWQRRWLTHRLPASEQRSAELVLVIEETRSCWSCLHDSDPYGVQAQCGRQMHALLSSLLCCVSFGPKC